MTEVRVDEALAPPTVEPHDIQPQAAVSVPMPVAGRLVVESDPAGALVTVDGRFEGQTPAVLTGMPFGPHEVQVARPGYAPEVVRVTLVEQQPSRRLSVVLSPGLQPERAMAGAIDIASRPRGARVLVNGRFLGRAPLRVPQLTPGAYTVRLELAGYQDYTRQVGVRAGVRTTLAPTLRSVDR